MSIFLKNKVAFATLFILLFSTNLFSSGFKYVADEGIVLKKTMKKIEEIGNELYKKTNISTVLIVKNHLDQKEFLQLKNKYLKETPKPCVVWIFSKTYLDRKDLGINKLFNSKELDGKFDIDHIFGWILFNGTFTGVLTVHKSKVDPTSAAFLNGYSDLAEMLAKSYGVELKSGIGSESLNTISVIKFIFYPLVFLVIIKLLYMKFRRKD